MKEKHNLKTHFISTGYILLHPPKNVMLVKLRMQKRDVNMKSSNIIQIQPLSTCSS